jgi:hypothetical protein
LNFCSAPFDSSISAQARPSHGFRSQCTQQHASAHSRCCNPSVRRTRKLCPCGWCAQCQSATVRKRQSYARWPAS